MAIELEDDDDESALTARLLPGTLARFATPLTWTMIHATLSFNRRRTWWRNAVADAEARGLIVWTKATRTWVLTAEGREHVKGIS